MEPEEVNNFEMDEDLADAYRNFKNEHVAGKDFMEFLDFMEESIMYTLKNVGEEQNLFRAQGFVSAIDTIKNRFLEADLILEESINKLKIVPEKENE